MRTMLNRVNRLEMLLIAAVLAGAGACEPLPEGGGQFWNGHDASFNPGGASGTGGTVDPTGIGGTIPDPVGAAGDAGSTGVGGAGEGVLDPHETAILVAAQLVGVEQVDLRVAAAEEQHRRAHGNALVAQRGTVLQEAAERREPGPRPDHDHRSVRVLRRVERDAG